MGNKNTLYSAYKKKDDEYYTLYEDISAEVSMYKNQLKGKKILCPCDWDESFNEEIVYRQEEFIPPDEIFAPGGSIKEVDLKKSKRKIEKSIKDIKCNFVKFLVAQADTYQIKSISVSGFDPKSKQGVKFENIDYKKYDLIITNPPFSLFDEFIDLLIENEKEFLVIGPVTALTYKKCFNYFKSDKLWLGYAKQLTGFRRPDGSLLLSKNPEGSVPRACKWYTNLDVVYRKTDRIILTEVYNKKDYPKYFNYDAIEVNEVSKIPRDYKGLMGVPTTFLSKYNPTQFKIIDKGVQANKTIRWDGDKSTLWVQGKHPKKNTSKLFKIDGKKVELYAPFERIIIKAK